MKKYKIVEERSNASGDYTVTTCTDSFAQTVDLLSKCDNPTKCDTESIKLFVLKANTYLEVGTIG